MARDHGGTIVSYARQAGVSPDRIFDFSASVNPLGPPEWTRSLVNRYLKEISHYPEPNAEGFVDRVAAKLEVPPACVLAGNGASELLFAATAGAGASWAIVNDPAYGDYRDASTASGLPVSSVPLRLVNGTTGRNSFRLNADALQERIQALETGGADGMVWLASPNNPTGSLEDPEQLLALIDSYPRHRFVLDESFLGFTEERSLCAQASRRPNLLVVRSLTKLYAVPGLRLGYMVGNRAAVASVRDSLPVWRVNVLAARFGVAAIEDEAYLAETRAFVKRERAWLREQLAQRIGPGLLRIFESDANFLLLELVGDAKPAANTPVDGQVLAKRTLAEGVAIRQCKQFIGLGDRFVRIAVRTRAENERLIAVLARTLRGPDATLVPMPGPRSGQRRRSLMVQGTSSSAGKSVLATAFCRILLRKGYRTVPFKAQNMSLNSFVTADGGEMGRAQVTQALASRVEPSVDMNPVLLKPHTHQSSQVIVRGKPVDELQAREYYRHREWLRAVVRESYDRLAAEYDVVILEGAGSPGEVNLKKHDIVNMHMARHVGSPVLLAGDIDRGGVFAGFVGTMGVLDEQERNLVRGFLVNRFRGDPGLLGNALEYTENYTGVPVLGVIPMVRDLGLPEEDSVTFKEQAGRSSGLSESAISIGLVDLPHISNFTDFDAFGVEQDVEIVRIRTAEDLGRPLDAIVIPGSKSVVADLQILREQGVTSAITRASAKGTEIVGLCGGYQMLGRAIHDPDGVESPARIVRGMGLLGIETTMAQGKTLRRSTAVHSESGCPVSGYEIHHGRTSHDAEEVDAVLVANESIGSPEQGPIDPGARAKGSRVWGTYLHGIFDQDEFRHWFLNRLRSRRSLPATPGKRYEIDGAIDRIADVVEEACDMDAILALVEESGV